ncbi:pol polyprotein [Tanacetum coccineum]
MLYYLTSLHVSYILTDSKPVDPYIVDGQNVPTEEQMTDYERVASQWNRNEYNCRNYILNALLWLILSMILFKPLQLQGEDIGIIGKEITGSSCMFEENLHKAKDYRHKKEYGGRNSEGNSNQANHVQSPKEFAGVMESFLTTNVVDWWLDTDATKDIYNSRKMFVSYQKVNESAPMFMGNGIASKIEGKGKVMLKLTFEKDIVLSNVLHVPNVTKNLISCLILSNKGLILVFKSDKFVITKGGVYVGKGYLDEGLFKLSIVTDDNVINNNNAGTSTAFVYMISPSFLWHSRLGHVNFRSLQRIINLGMLPKFSKDKISKCEICVESKFTSHSHKSVEKSNEILGLIHIDLCDFKATPSTGGKNYYITFIDDCSRFCYVYLINTKEEALNMFKTYKAEVENQLDKKIKILRSD